MSKIKNDSHGVDKVPKESTILFVPICANCLSLIAEEIRVVNELYRVYKPNGDYLYNQCPHLNPTRCPTCGALFTSMIFHSDPEAPYNVHCVIKQAQKAIIEKSIKEVVSGQHDD